MEMKKLPKQYEKAGKKGPDALVFDRSKNTVSPADVTTRSNTSHEAKTNRDTQILEQGLPKRFRNEGVTVGRPIEILTDSKTGQFRINPGKQPTKAPR